MGVSESYVKQYAKELGLLSQYYSGHLAEPRNRSIVCPCVILVSALRETSLQYVNIPIVLRQLLNLVVLYTVASG